jgi:hypothetical protein
VLQVTLEVVHHWLKHRGKQRTLLSWEHVGKTASAAISQGAITGEGRVTNRRDDHNVCNFPPYFGLATILSHHSWQTNPISSKLNMCKG